VKDDEWASCCFFVDQAFKGDFDEDKRDAYRFFLDGLDPELMMAALRALVEDGEEWLPAAGRILKRARSLQEPPVPGWAEVYPALVQATDVGGRTYTDGEAEKTAKAVAWLDEYKHRVIARFYETQGWARLARTGFDDQDYGALRENDLRRQWEEFVDVARQRLVQGRALEPSAARGEIGPSRLDQAALMRSLQPRPEIEGPK
jgi:hypothetical protein